MKIFFNFSHFYLILIIFRRYKATPFTEILRGCVSATTAILIFFLFTHLVYNYKLSVEKGGVEVGTSILKTKYFRTFIIEVVINLIHCPPGVHLVFELSQIDKKIIISLDTLLSTLMICRIYLVLRLFVHYTQWKSELAVEYCEMEGCEASTAFAMKAMLQTSPLQSLFLALMISSYLFGSALTNFERPLNELTGDASAMDFSFIWNGMWLAAVTMTTGNKK